MPHHHPLSQDDFDQLMAVSESRLETLIRSIVEDELKRRNVPPQEGAGVYGFVLSCLYMAIRTRTAAFSEATGVPAETLLPPDDVVREAEAQARKAIFDLLPQV